jgi:integrase
VSPEGKFRASRLVGDAGEKETQVRQILTDSACKTKPPRTGRLEIADLRQAGLVLRITANGARSFAYRFRHPHSRKTLRATIGAYPAINLEAARKRAREMAGQLQEGINPIEAKRHDRQSASSRTFEALAERYLREHAERHKRPRSAEEDKRNLTVHILPKWGKRDFHHIRRANVIELIESIVRDGKHAAANRVHSLISKIFSFAIDADLLEANPAARLKKRGVENIGRRILSDEEIKVFWNGITLRPVSRRIGLALRLALLTGARANEITGARKAEFENIDNPDLAAWVIPAARTKNKRDHWIPLSPLALETIRSALELTSNEDEFLFPTHLRRAGPIDRHALTSAMRRFAENSAAKTWQAEPPSPHDLRRTLSTRLAQIGILKEIRDRVLNHATALRDIGSRHYNLHEFQEEKRTALNRWSGELAALTTLAATHARQRRHDQ